MKPLNLFFLIVSILFFNTSTSQTSPEQMVLNMGRGINIGNVLTAPVEGDWAAPLTEAYIQDVAAVGFTNVRIPIDFFGTRTSGDTSVYSKNAGTASSYSGSPSDYVVSSIYLNRIEEVMTWALNNNLVVILDVHGSTLKDEFLYTFSPKPEHASYYTNPTSAKRVADNEKFRAIWSAIANRFKDYDYDLLFEVINEPYFFLTDIEMDTLNTDIISIIRSTGSNNTDRNIIITGGSENSFQAPLQISPSIITSDDNLIATFHYYWPRDFTASSEELHNDFNWGTTLDKFEIDANFGAVQSWSQSNNIPILLGEFGADNEGGYNYDTNTYGDFGGPENASRVEYYSYLGQKAIDLGFAFATWDAGHKSNKTIYIEDTRSWVVDILDALLDANNINTTNWYVSMTGDDNNNGNSPTTPFRTFNEVQNNAQPGDTIFIIGTYTNDSYNPSYSYSGNINDPHLWHGENTVRINNLNGTATSYITIKPFDASTVIKGDGANIFRVTNSSYIRVEGLEVYGEVENIPLSTSKAMQFIYREEGSSVSLRRVPLGTTDAQVLALYSEPGSLPALSNTNRPTYVDTRGFYFSNVHHLDLVNNKAHHMPGNGFRVADCDYINIIGNEVYATSRKSYTGTHGLVVTDANSEVQGFLDTNDDYKIFILNNLVYENYNEIYSWAPTKTFIKPVIDEGKGISLQRNDIDDNGTPGNTNDDTGWLHGRILVANNITYKNGFSGLHSNSGTRIDFINNTSYLNSFTKSVYAPETGNGGNIGISSQSGTDIKIINNIAVIDTNLNKSAIASSNSTGLIVDSNIIYGTTFDTGIPSPIQEDSEVVSVQTNTLMVDPLFVDPLNNDFNLQSGSPARDIANTSFAPTHDFFGSLRDANPDLGAVEYFPIASTTYVFDGSWTPQNPSGVSNSNDIINVISGNANNSTFNISDQTEAESLNISLGAKLVINVGGSLTVENFDNQGTLTIRSNSTRFGTFVPNSIISNGNVEYRRYVNPNDIEAGNDLISAPLQGETFGDFVLYQNNENAIFNNPNDTSQKLFGPFNKTSNTYTIFDTDTNDANIVLNAGIGYRAASEPSSDNTFVFSGVLEIGNVNVPILFTGTDFSPWNLIGNPYTANLDFETFFDVNKPQLSDDAFQAVYGYNATFNRWTIWNQLTIDNMETNELIVPGQAFFVSSKPDNGTISFTPNMRRTGVSDDFILNRSSASTNTVWANLKMDVASSVFNTHIYFVEGKTKGLDLGFDAGAFNGDAEGIFTHLVEDNIDVDMAIQVLPYNDFNTVIVPLGVKVDQGVQFSIGLDTAQSSLPANTEVYLEDALTNTWTLLNTQEYTITSNSNLSGTGRFFIHFQEETLSTSEIDNQNIKLFVDKSNSLHIEGYLNQSSSIEIYNILGQQLVSKILEANTTSNEVELNSFPKGVYIVRLSNEKLDVTRKIVLK